MAWRCDVCGQTDKWDGKCACDDQAEAVERVPELEQEVAALKAELSQCRQLMEADNAALKKREAENAKLREALDHIKRFNCHLGCGAIAAYALGEKV